MSFAHVDATLVHYFYISLAAGVLIILLAWGTTLAPAARVIGIALMAVGMYGAIKGAPYWSLRYEQQRAARTYEREAEAYFDRACLERAVIQLPPSPTRTDGLVWLDVDAASQSYLSSNDHPRDFIGPGRGRYQIIEVQLRDAPGYLASVWEPGPSHPDVLRIKDAVRDAPTQQFALRTRSISTPQDEKYGVDAVESTIIDLKAHETIARRVALTRFASGSKLHAPLALCPERTFGEVNCTVAGCSVLPFVLAAIPPTVPGDDSGAYQLYRGVGTVKVVCGQLLTVGPRVNPENLEWWASGTEGWENLHLRVIGTRDQVYCERFFWSSNTIWPRLRFEDGGSEYSLRSVFESKNRGTAEAPRKLLETVSAR